MKKLVIFDFDGVLLDSFPYTYEINRLTSECVGKNLSESQFREFFDGSFHKEFFKFLNLDEEKLQELLDFKYKIFFEHYKKSKLFPFCKELINSLEEKNIKMAIISSAQEESIKKILTENKILDKFFFIAGMNKLGKVENLKRCMEEANISVVDTFFVTDTNGDILEGKKIGIKTIAVSWGYTNHINFGLSNPDYIAYKVEHILEIIDN